MDFLIIPEEEKIKPTAVYHNLITYNVISFYSYYVKFKLVCRM